MGVFSDALRARAAAGFLPVIPDLKCRSPQEGELLRGRGPAELAKSLARAGAPALSVVTEPARFGGSLEVLREAARATGLPVLRKDFITRPEQLDESVRAGASAVLLIAAILERPGLLESLFARSVELGLEPLVETHTEAELRRASMLPVTLLGINNRDITALELDGGTVRTTERLIPEAPSGALVVSESGIETPSDAARAKRAGAGAVLVGTAILCAPDPAAFYRSLSRAGEAGA